MSITSSLPACADCREAGAHIETFVGDRICETCHARRVNAAAIVDLVGQMATPEETQAFLGLLPTSPPDDPVVLLNALDHVDVIISALKAPTAVR